MDIYILRDGEQIGPFSKDAAQILVRQGTISTNDLAWRRGTLEWRPLGEVLNSVPSASEPPTAAEPAAKPPAEPAAEAPVEASTEPATASQIAFLSYFGIAIPAGLSKDAAETLITNAGDDPTNAKRLASWEVDRLRLHPDLFNPEIAEKKEDRVQLYYDLCETAGADHFTGVTKAHCQVLVAFLDVKYPRWDANRAEATERYFFPAIAEKFPQLVSRAWRSRVSEGDRSSVLARATRKLPTTKLTRRYISPWVASARGIALGLVILAVLYAVYLFVQAHLGQPGPAGKAGVSTSASTFLALRLFEEREERAADTKAGIEPAAAGGKRPRTDEAGLLTV